MSRVASAFELQSSQRTRVGQRAWLSTAISALVLALAGLGDALLYPTLPLYAAQLGVPLIWIGVLLSINKFIRLGGNHILGLTISHWGYKRVATLGVLLASLSTFAYGLQPPIWLWLVSRMAWGMAFAALRLCALGYATEAKQQGLHLGLSNAIKEIGPMSALFVGPVLITQIDVHTAFLVFGAVTALALPVTWMLPDDAHAAKPEMSGHFTKPTWFDGLIFATALADGILIVTIGLLLLGAGISEAAVLTLSAFLLAVKRASVIVVGPLSGWLADRWHIRKVFLLAVVGFVVGLVLISTGVTIAGITVLFVSTAINQVLAAGVALEVSPDTRLNTLSALTTWSDLGTAVGAFIGGFVLVLSGPSLVYGTLAVIVSAVVLKVARSD